jgi:hypothetical protein
MRLDYLELHSQTKCSAEANLSSRWIGYPDVLTVKTGPTVH